MLGKVHTGEHILYQPHLVYSLRAESSNRLQTEQVIEDKLVGIRDHQYNQLLSQLGTLACICRGVGLQELHQDLAG